MARGDLTPQEVELRQQISDNIKTIMYLSNLKQIDVHVATGLPKSTINGYIKGTSIPIAGNVQKLANFFGVKKSDIDPRYDTSKTLAVNCELKNLSVTRQKLDALIEKLNEPAQKRLLAYAEYEFEKQN
jgi:transcriptional regulator with XRE-family HTH domain